MKCVVSRRKSNGALASLAVAVLLSAASSSAVAQVVAPQADAGAAAQPQPEEEIDIDAVLRDSQSAIRSMDQAEAQAVRNRCLPVVRSHRNQVAARIQRMTHSANAEAYNATVEYNGIQAAMRVLSDEIRSHAPLGNREEFVPGYIRLSRMISRLAAMTPAQIEAMGRERYQQRLTQARSLAARMSEDLNQHLGTLAANRQANANSNACSQTGVGRVFGGSLHYTLRDGTFSQIANASGSEMVPTTTFREYASLRVAVLDMKSALFSRAIQCVANTDWGGDPDPVSANLERVIYDQSVQALLMVRCHFQRFSGEGNELDYIVQCGTLDLGTLALSGVGSEQESTSVGGISDLQPPELNLARLTNQRIQENQPDCLGFVNEVLAEAPVAASGSSAATITTPQPARR